MMRVMAFVYGVVSYVAFLASFLYAVGFVGNLVVPKSIDSGDAGPLGQALLVNAALLGVFAVQHSVMARRGFKKVWTRIVHHSIERSTYVLITSLLLGLLFYYWQPMPATIWQVDGGAATALMVLSGIGWLMVPLSTFMTDHFDLFGLRQVWFFLRGRPYEPLPFSKHGFYRVVRHPLLLGFIVAFWATPHMTQGHLLFAVATTAYMLIAIVLEERDLVHFHGAEYESYQREVPRLLPIPVRQPR